MTNLRAGGASDVGRVRRINEDRYLVGEGIFAVADGVGGHQAGEIASQTSVDTLAAHFIEHTARGLVNAVSDANQAVWRLAQQRADRRGMGTTISAVALVVDAPYEQLAVANVGDSRVYLLHQGDFQQLTQDDSLVEEMVREGRISPAEAQVHPQRSIITRALGMDPHLEVEVCQLLRPFTGDRYLLCSDGLTNELSDERIAATLRRLADPEEAAKELVRLARAEGGGDNITAVVVDVAGSGPANGDLSAAADSHPELLAEGTSMRTGPGAEGLGHETEVAGAVLTEAPPARPLPPTAGRISPPPDRRRFPTWRLAVFVVALIAVASTVVGAIRWYAKGSYYLGIDEAERVVIFRGRPGGLLWFEPEPLKNPRRLTSADLLEAEKTSLENGVPFPNLSAADRYANTLRGRVDLRATPRPTITSPSLEPTPLEVGPSITIAPSPPS